MKPLNFSSWQSITSFFFSVCVFFKWRAKKLAHLTHEFVLRWCNVFCFCRNLVIFFMWRTVFSSTTNFIKQLHIICLCTYTDTGSVRIPRLHACRSGYVGSVTTACFCALLMWQNRYKRNRHIGVRHAPLTMPYSCLSLFFCVCRFCHCDELCHFALLLFEAAQKVSASLSRPCLFLLVI